MRIAGITYESLVDGPGIRVVIFVQGCELNCLECHNPDSHSQTGGREYTVREVMRLMKKAGPGRKMVRGVTLSGGEPFMQAGDCAQIALEAKRIGWDVTTYTGCSYDDLKKREDADINALLDLTDYLIDGPYIHEQRDLDLKFRGSANQRIIDMAATRKQNGRVKLYYGK
ncbi:MAG: radical SAM protein [Clostridiales bacterium]|jgi:anaerobic ribonucleoside-triphosphate reductase activating protein|nr:radical SAM protein [Clostridiales bacterium]